MQVVGRRIVIAMIQRRRNELERVDSRVVVMDMGRTSRVKALLCRADRSNWRDGRSAGRMRRRGDRREVCRRSDGETRNVQRERGRGIPVGRVVGLVVGRVLLVCQRG